MSQGGQARKSGKRPQPVSFSCIITVWISFPYVTCTAMNASTTPPAERTGRRTILVVEDEIVIARDLQRILRRTGYHVPDVAVSAEEALWFIEEHDPDIALLDIVIEGKRDGISLARLIREEYQLPFLFITSHADRATVDRAKATRPNGYLVKPFTADEVYAATEIALANYVDQQQDVDLAVLAEAERPEGGGLPASTLQRVTAYIGKHFNENLTLDDLATVAGMSTYYFCHQFKESVGIPPYQYIVQERLEEAKRLLRSTDWPIMQVCLAVGYESQGHFTTLFKREVGVTPGAYRRA